MPEKNGKLHPNHNIPPFNFKKVNEFSRPLERKKVVLDCESAIYNWRLKKFGDLSRVAMPRACLREKCHNAAILANFERLFLYPCYLSANLDDFFQN